MKKGKQKIMGEKKEFNKEELSDFRCILEYFETLCVFLSWFASLFIVVRVDLDMRTRA